MHALLHGRSVRLLSTVFLVGLLAVLGHALVAPAEDDVSGASSPATVELVVARGHGGPLKALAFSPDGTILASGAGDRTVRLWEVATGRELRSMLGAQHGEVSRVDWIGNERLVSSGSGTVHVWDPMTGRRLATLDDEAVGAEIRSYGILDPDPTQPAFLVATADPGALHIWRPGERTRKLDVEADGLLAVSSAGQVAVTRVENVIHVLSIPSWQTLATLALDEDLHERLLGSVRPRTAAISRDGRFLAVTCESAGISIGGSGSPRSLLLFEIVNGDDAALVLRSVRDEWTKQYGMGFGYKPPCFSADGTRLVVPFDDEVFCLETPSLDVVSRTSYFETDVNVCAISLDGSRVAWGGDTATMGFLDATTGDPGPPPSRHGVGIATLDASLDGRTLVVGLKDGTVRTWDLTAGEATRAIDAHAVATTLGGSRSSLRCVRLSGDGRLVLSVGPEDAVRFWDVATGGFEGQQVADEEEGGVTVIECCAISGDGSVVVAGGLYDELMVLDLDERRRLGNLVGEPPPDSDEVSGVSQIALSFDGTIAATVHADGARLWDVEAGKQVRGHYRGSDLHQYGVESVAISRDGSLVATGEGWGGLVHVWETASGDRRHRIQAHVATVNALDFDPRGGRLLTTGGDRLARIWDLETGELIHVLGGHSDDVTGGRYLGDSGRIATSSHDATIRIWDGDSGELLCQIACLEGGNWAVATPDGRFDVPDIEQARTLHWVASDDPLRALPLEQFMREYYEPQLLSKVLKNAPMHPVASVARLNRARPEVVAIRVDRHDSAADTVRVTVDVKGGTYRTRSGSSSRSGARDVRLFRNGQLVGYAKGAIPGVGKGKPVPVAFETIRLPRNGSDSVEFSAYVLNEARPGVAGDTGGVKSETFVVRYELPEPPAPARGRAYVIGFGVDDYAHEAWDDLSFAARDADVMTERLATVLERRDAFEGVTRILLAEPGTKGESKSAGHELPARKDLLGGVFRMLAGLPVEPSIRGHIERGAGGAFGPARPEDLVMVSVAGHGTTDADGEFHVIPADASDDPRTWISAHELADWWEPVDAGNMVFIIDTCHSSATVGSNFKAGPMGSRGFGQLSYDKRMRILAASQAAEVALESGEIEHGLLTYALTTDGLEKGRADFEPMNGVITVGEWLRYAAARVPGLAEEVRRGDVRSVARSGFVPQEEELGRIVQTPSVFDHAEPSKDIVLLVR